jgi:hypothetical protein
VKLPWAFAEDPTKKYDLLFHVLPSCIYDVILGHEVLTATETFSKYRRRLTECVFSVARVFKLSFLGNRCHRLGDFLDDAIQVLVVPDIGVEDGCLVSAVLSARHSNLANPHVISGTQRVMALISTLDLGRKISFNSPMAAIKKRLAKLSRIGPLLLAKKHYSHSKY